MSAVSVADLTGQLAAVPYMALKRALVAQGLDAAKSASSKEQLIQIVAASGVDVQSLLGTTQEMAKTEAEAKAKLEQAKASKDAGHRAAVDAARAAAKQAAQELSSALTAKFTQERLFAFVEANLDGILASGLLASTTGDGMNRLRVVDGVYTVLSVERGCEYGASEIARPEAVAVVAQALNHSFHSFSSLDATGCLLHPQTFQLERWELQRHALQSVLHDFIASFPA
jgi:hypothetical protein